MKFHHRAPSLLRFAFTCNAGIIKRTLSRKKKAMKRIVPLLALIMAATALMQAKNPPATRNPKWAQPISITGVPNLHKISDGLYRGAQPTTAGIKELKKMGIKTIVNLRADHSDKEMLGTTGLAYEEIPLKAWRVKNEDVVKFLKIATDKSRQPVFFHCAHGADRTGTMCAAYRVVVQGWTKEDAIKEMKKGGYGFHALWFNLARYIKRLDVNAIKKAIPGDDHESIDSSRIGRGRTQACGGGFGKSLYSRGQERRGLSPRYSRFHFADVPEDLRQRVS
jgi:protein tyrosine phosphatase (PTP) superfamily phosphohydrolase (DUF442 family)